ncbi:hypothetical protein K438DRAFT_926184 [Mycena galopus ATCC 62051]|nr:hypothetical protein K438DRAFT_926184 [Mycena galopus ATCC 62051]
MIRHRSPSPKLIPIPPVLSREANLVRFYVTAEGRKVVSITRDKATQDICIARAKKIFEPLPSSRRRGPQDPHRGAPN